MTALSVVWMYCRTVIRARLHDERGASIVEYAFLASLVAVVCIGAMSFVGGATDASLSESAGRMTPGGP